MPSPPTVSTTSTSSKVPRERLARPRRTSPATPSAVSASSHLARPWPRDRRARGAGARRSTSLPRAAARSRADRRARRVRYAVRLTTTKTRPFTHGSASRRRRSPSSVFASRIVARRAELEGLVERQGGDERARARAGESSPGGGVKRVGIDLDVEVRVHLARSSPAWGTSTGPAPAARPAPRARPSLRRARARRRLRASRPARPVRPAAPRARRRGAGGKGRDAAAGRMHVRRTTWRLPSRSKCATMTTASKARRVTMS